jgi:hypothetical protein
VPINPNVACRAARCRCTGRGREACRLKAEAT